MVWGVDLLIYYAFDKVSCPYDLNLLSRRYFFYQDMTYTLLRVFAVNTTQHTV